MIRLFAAIAVPQPIGAALASRQRGLVGARWRPLDSLHITLRFFGEVAEPLADDLDAALSAVGGPPLALTLEGAGAFGEAANLHAVWAGVAENPALNQLARRCEIAARRAGLAAERRAYRPHVTLAYLSRADPTRVAAWIQANSLLRAGPFEAGSFRLYSSRLASGGSSHRLERSYPLARP